MKTATLVKSLGGWRGDARLYKLSEPLEGADHVVVSAVSAMFTGPETYIFASDANGECESMIELAGSFRGGMNHVQALEGAGYEVSS